MSGWRDIRTAPRDGTIILLFVPDDDDGEIVWPAHWVLSRSVSAAGVFPRNRPNGWQHCSGGRWTAEDTDQRWMPLPEPPPVTP